MNPWRHGTVLFDLEADPAQEHPIADDETELRMLRLLARLMHDNEAPHSQFERLGIPYDREPDPEHLLVRAQAARAADLAEPLPADLPARDVLGSPVAELMNRPGVREVLDHHLPELSQTELVGLPPHTSVLDLARRAVISANTLRKIAEALAGEPD